MKIRVIIFSLVFALISCVALSSVFAQAETLTITTYYPSPYGVYGTLRLYPNNNYTPGGACSNNGEMYYDESENNFYGCQNLVWRRLGGTGGVIVRVNSYEDAGSTNLVNVSSEGSGIQSWKFNTPHSITVPAGQTYTFIGSASALWLYNTGVEYHCEASVGISVIDSSGVGLNCGGNVTTRTLNGDNANLPVSSSCVGLLEGGKTYTINAVTRSETSQSMGGYHDRIYNLGLGYVILQN